MIRSLLEAVVVPFCLCVATVISAICGKVPVLWQTQSLVVAPRTWTTPVSIPSFVLFSAFDTEILHRDPRPCFLSFSLLLYLALNMFLLFLSHFISHLPTLMGSLTFCCAVRRNPSCGKHSITSMFRNGHSWGRLQLHKRVVHVEITEGPHCTLHRRVFRTVFGRYSIRILARMSVVILFSRDFLAPLGKRWNVT
jgi:hypothetical protein